MFLSPTLLYAHIHLVESRQKSLNLVGDFRYSALCAEYFVPEGFCAAKVARPADLFAKSREDYFDCPG